MSYTTINTGIVVDFPTAKTGRIFVSDYVKDLFNSSNFKSKLVKHKIDGAFGSVVFPDEGYDPSHVVVGASIVNEEIQFKIKILDNQEGYKLKEMIDSNDNLIGKIIGICSDLGNGKIKLEDIVCVHIKKV